MTNIKSYYQSGGLIASLLNYQESKSYSSKIEVINYDGINNICPPAKMISPKKFKGKSIILYPGASPYAENHPKMEMLGVILAQNGYRVYIPRIPPLKTLDISSSNVEWFICFYK